MGVILMVTTLDQQLDAFFHISRDEQQVSMIQTQRGDLDDYITALTKTINENTKNRHFKFKSSHKEVAVLLKEIAKDEVQSEVFFENAQKIAERLLATEITTQARQGDFNELQKGSLIISKYTEGVNINFLISKVEHESFLNSDELRKQSGIPYEKGTLKTCFIELDEETLEILDIIVTDSNSKISQYWSESFLELEELKSDELNTLHSFQAMDQYISRKVKKKSPKDYTYIRNHLITYYRGQSEFDYDDMLQTVFGEYNPEDDEIDVNTLKEEARSLPEDKSFDRVFSIEEKAIKAKIRQVHKLNKVSELRIVSGSTDFGNLIKAKEIEGVKVLQIKVENDEVFRYFKHEE